MAEDRAGRASAAVSAAIVDDPDADGTTLLARGLERGGFWDVLASRCTAARVEPADLSIVVKPDLGGFDVGSVAITTPALVEALIDLLHDRGFANVSIGAAPDGSAIWAENRDVLATADLLGYRFVTSRGRNYDIVDLSENLEPAAFARGGVMDGASLSRSWTSAHVRICFAKNKTDERNGYALCLDGLLETLPQYDKDYYYRYRVDAGDVIVELLRAFPVDFAIIDATVSAHGSGGTRSPVPLATATIIASSNVLLADVAGALKMGLDPYCSAINAKAMRAIGLPLQYRIDGNLATFPGWLNVHPLLVDSVRQRDAWVGVSRTIGPWLQTLNPELFPLKNPIDAKANAVVAPFVSKVDEEPNAFWTLVGANYGLGWIHSRLEAYRVLFDKDKLRHRPVPLNLDLQQLTSAEYEASIGELLSLADLLRAVPADASGLRWRYLERAVVFEIERVLPIPFDEFVAKVDVSKTIQLMNDYIGGVAVPVARDAQGRTIHQAERNIYLPQPNYVAAFGGKVIDVTKLECAEYAADAHRMFWKTIKSENDSASHDDGIVTFRRAAAETHVSIFGRQLFTLPPFLEALMLDLQPTVKNALVTHAYTTFFDRTFANFEAVVEGRDIRIGRPWHRQDDVTATEPRPVDALAEFVAKLGDNAGDDIVAALMKLIRPPSGFAESTGGAIDDDGFVHVRPSASSASTSLAPDGKVTDGGLGRIGEFYRDLAEAMRRDWRSPSAAHGSTRHT